MTASLSFLVTAVLSAVLGAASCTASQTGSAQQPSTRASGPASAVATAAPALTKQQALDQIAHYSQINNKANATRNRRLLDTIEDGPLYAMSVADYKEEEGLPKAGQETYRPWSYDLGSTRLYIPRFSSGQQRWFAAVTYSGKNNRYARLLVMAEQAAPRRWEMVAAVDVDDKRLLPAITLDSDGYATALDAASAQKVAKPVVALRKAVLDNYATGGTVSGKKTFAATKTSTRQIQVHERTTKKFGDRGSTTFSAAPTEFPDSYALRTDDGGALVVFAHTHTQLDVAHRGLQINPDKKDRAWLGTAPSPLISYTFTCSDVAAVPATPRKPALIGYTCRRTNAQGTRSLSAG
ncbi:hypothetical protein [Streptomyces sp. NPDC001508]|uniref:hypothetical protein n=1 Tax=Streptomyces sp. NPDC001508 TaxID=3154656 RepID=UPI00331ED886